MKIQDVGFLIVLAAMVFSRKPIYFIYAGIACLFLAIPLFSQWVFFTAERLTWYAAAYVSIFIVYTLIQRKDKS